LPHAGGELPENNLTAEIQEKTVQLRFAWVAFFVTAAVCLSPVRGRPAAAPEDPAWNKVVAAAKKEAKVVIIGPLGSEVRDAYTIGFQKKYPEIEVDFSGMRGAEVAPKLLAELNAKHYLTDIAVAGTTTALVSLVPASAVVPLQPYLVGPEARDVSKWRDGKHHFSDSTEKYNLYFGARVQVAFVYNTELNPAATMKSKIKTWHDLLNPEWKGKIAMLDPRQAGAGLDLSTYWYTNEKAGLGKEFMRKLFSSQEVFISREEQQILDFVARGRHSLAIGPSGTLTFQLISRGLPLALFGSGEFQGGGFVTASNGTITVVRNAPHQNAVKVYIDYLLSREGQLNWSKASGLASLRTDVAKDHIPEVLVPNDGVKYQETHLEQYVTMRKEIVDFLNTVIRR
jgi:iron(III) transport system substrate-binding protein